jgi:autotransporter-associated beta strand protein
MVKNGSGILQLTGTSSLSGATSVSAGTLVVNGSIASSPVSLASGTVLKGTGTLGSLSASSGAIIRPGNSIGTLNVAGDFALDAGSTLEVEFNDSSMDKVVATGDVSLSGDVSFVLYGDDGYFTVTQTIVETSGGTLTGEFASIAADNDFTATVNYSGTTATATVSKTLASSTLDAPMSSQAALTQTVAMNMINTLHKASESVIEEPAGFFEIMKFGASSASREGQSGYTSHGVVKNVGGIMNFKGALVGGGLFFSDGKVDRKRYRGADEVDSMGVSVGVRKALAFSRLGEMALNATIGGGRYRFKNHRYVTIDNTPEEGIGDGHGQFSFVSVEGSKTLPFHRYGDTSVSADLTGTWVRHGGWDESGLSQNNALVTKSEATVLTTTAGARHRFSPVYFKNSQAYMVPALNAYYEHAKLIGSKSATVTDGSATYRLKPVMHESPHFGLKGMIDIPLNKLSLAFNAGVQVADKKSSSSFGAFIQIPLK